MLFRVRYDRQPHSGLDGTWYDFSANYGLRSMNGEVWSPDENTEPALLVAVVEAMEQYCGVSAQSGVSLEHAVLALETRLHSDGFKH
jgi:hypothetical protein